MIEAFSIIIQVYNDLDGLKSTIKDLRVSLIPIRFEIVVVNDGSKRLISDWLTDQGIKEVSIKKRAGSYNARNQGIEAAQFDHLLFVDAGVHIKPGWYDIAKNAIERNDYVAFSINMSVDESMPLTKRYSEFYEFRCEMLWNQNHFGPTAFLWVSGRVFEETGGFDHELWSGGDMELGNRCWHANFKMAFIPNNHIWHPPRSLREKYRKNVRILKGILKLKKKYPNRLMKLPKVGWKAFLLSPFKFIYTVYKVKSLPAYKSGKWKPITIAWSEFLHQTMYYLAMLKVLIKR